jgi:hypothetical protein
MGNVYNGLVAYGSLQDKSSPGPNLRHHAYCPRAIDPVNDLILLSKRGSGSLGCGKWLLIHDALPPASFERNTVLGRLLLMAGRFEVTLVIAVSGHSLNLGQRDPTGLLDRVGRVARFVSIYSVVVILRANPAIQQPLERR